MEMRRLRDLAYVAEGRMKKRNAHDLLFFLFFFHPPLHPALLDLVPRPPPFVAGSWHASARRVLQ